MTTVGLINGLTSKNTSADGEHAAYDITVPLGETARVRVCAGAANTRFTLTVRDHNMTVIAADGALTGQSSRRGYTSRRASDGTCCCTPTLRSARRATASTSRCRCFGHATRTSPARLRAVPTNSTREAAPRLPQPDLRARAARRGRRRAATSSSARRRSRPRAPPASTSATCARRAAPRRASRTQTRRRDDRRPRRARGAPRAPCGGGSSSRRRGPPSRSSTRALDKVRARARAGRVLRRAGRDRARGARRCRELAVCRDGRYGLAVRARGARGRAAKPPARASGRCPSS